MTRILFVCLGNICRSPMAEYIMKDLVSKAGLSERFEIASAATSAWEIGNPVYPPARQKLAEHGIDCNGKTARQPPKYTVFFKAKDADALTSAFEEFTNRKLKAKEKPSVLEQLNKLKELVAAILPDKVRHKSQERDL